MACEAALRMGAGLVTLGIPKSLNPIMEVKLTEVMTEPLPETPKQTLSLRAFDSILRLCENKKAVVIGPGIGTVKETQTLILKLVKALKLPLILDADGLTALATRSKALPSTNRSLILTPHPGEMARLTRSDPKRSPGRPDRDQPKFLPNPPPLSGLERAPHPDRHSQGEIFINPTGNPGMASGGTGDVLTGMIGGLICQGIDILPSLQVSVFLHGLAGDKVASEKGERATVATDLIQNPAEVLQGRV